jgi:hypothetical protein
MHHSTEKGTQMSNQSHTIGSPLHRFGVAGPARSRAFPGTGAPSITKLALVVAATLALFVLSTAPARAEVLHDYLSQITEIPATGPHGEAVAEPGKLAGVNSMTFDSGDLWVGEHSRVDEFNASGGFVSQLLVPFAGSIAVGHASGETQLYVSGGYESGTIGGYNTENGATDEVAVFDPTTKIQIGSWTGAGTPAGTFRAPEGGGVWDVAVDNSSNLADEARGDVYVADRAFSCGACGESPQDERAVDVFEPQAGGGEKYVTQLTGACPTEGMTVGGAGCEEGKGLIPFNGFDPVSEAQYPRVPEVVVDQSNGDVFVAGITAAGGAAVDVFEPLVLHQYRFVRQLPIGAVWAVGGGPENNDIYAGASEFSPAGVFLGELTGTPAGPFSGVESVAVDDEPSSPSFEHVYVGDFVYGRENGPEIEMKKVGGVESETGVIDEFGPNVVIPDVTTIAATQATPTSATLNGEVDPLEAETHEGAECWFEWGATTAFGKEAPCEPRQVAEHEGFVPVHAQLQGLLEPDTTYYYRLQAKNKNEANLGKESETQHFTTLGAGIHGESVSKVTSTSVMLEAAIDPNKAPTTYYFQYGVGASYEYESPAAPGSSIGSGETDVNAAQHVQENLAPDTVYHYRVVAVSEIELEGGGRETKEFDGEDRTFTTQAPGSSRVLPDDRQWELVSPPNKFGALIYPINEFSGVIQAAADGDAITYGTSDVTESQPRGSTYHLVQALSRRGAGASSWSSQDIETPNNYETGVRLNVGYEYRFFSSDLSLALLEPEGAFTPLERDGVSEEVPPRATERTAYLRSDFTCQATPSTCYTPLVTEANTPPETKIGGNEENLFGNAVEFVGATPDLSHVVLTSNVPLIEGASYKALYEWAGGRLRPVSVLPLNEGGAWVANAELGGLTSEDLEARNAVSTDGSRVVWSDQGDQGLYMSDTAGGKTESVRVGGAGAEFMDASSDDSKVFFEQGGIKNSEEEYGGDLYVFEVTSGEGEPLAGTVTRLTEGAEVQGTVLGVSEDGSYVYFVAQGVLGDGAAHGANTGNCRPESGLSRIEGSCNLYVDHYNGESKEWEAPSFIAAPSAADFLDWSTAILRTHTSRVSPNGRYLAFMSDSSLTGYDNIDLNEHPTGEEEKDGVMAGTRVKHYDQEVYLYDAVERKLVCASCNPTGARPVGVKVEEAAVVDDEMWGAGGTWLSANVPGFTPFRDQRALYQSRYLSDSGRLFFNSHEALVPQDVNGQWDVYEYEPPGIGDCTAVDVTFSPRSGGCVGLVSSGESAQESGFLDASENGDDVFFLTTSRLSSQDFDDDYDVYDAHVCGAEGVACAPVVTPLPPCTTEASCKPAPTPQPTLYAPPASATFSGPGNLAPSPPPAPVRVAKKKTVRCVRGKVRDKRGDCVKQKSKKHKVKKASDDRRAGR